MGIEGKTNRILVAGVIVGSLIFGVFIWPTMYRYDRLKWGDKEYPVRINRLTGHSATFVGSRGWVDADRDADEAEARTAASTPLKQYELEQLTGSAEVKGSFFSGTIHNNTGKVVTELLFEVTLEKLQRRKHDDLLNKLDDIKNPFLSTVPRK